MNPSEMTIDELARQAGTTTRNVRAYQSRGLLPPPRIEGRVGYYEQGHLARLKLIGQLQERGFSLAGIVELLRAWEQGRGLSDVLGFEEALTAPWSDEGETTVDREELERLFPEAAADPEVLRRAVELEILVPEGEAFRVPSPRVLQVGRELVAAGVPISAALDEAPRLRADSDRIASRFVELFATHVWEPFVAAGMPADDLPRVTEALRRVRPLASEAVLSFLADAMEREVEAATAVGLSQTAAPADHTAAG